MLLTAAAFAAVALAMIAAAPVPGAEKPTPSRQSDVGKTAAVNFSQDVKPFLEEHCIRCHGEKKHKGNLRLDALGRDFGDSRVAGRWMEIMGRINSGEMPPKKEPRPNADKVARVSEWISAQLMEADAVRQAAADEKVSFHRLTREEYRNTIRDLLGVTYDAADPTGLPDGS